METQSKQHPSAVHLAALGLGKLQPDAAANVQSHLDECSDCRSFVSDTPRNELAEIIKQANYHTAADQNTMATGWSGTVAGVPKTRIGDVPEPDIPATPGGPSASPALVRIEHAVSESEIPRDLFAQSKYRIIRVLGRGGMGVVYQAEHVRLNRPVAIKVINAALVDHPQALLRFEEESRAVASLSHENIARAYDAETFGALQTLIMEFVRGQTLSELLKSRGQLSVMEACRCIRQALLGLQHAFDQGLIHRDLKLQNLMLERATGKVKILDFGLAKMRERRGTPELTGTNQIMGTCEYMAPEQAVDPAKADIRADIYSLGCSLYYLIAGVLPFEQTVLLELLNAHQKDTPRPLHDVRADVPKLLSDLVARMLAKDPTDRPQTPRESADALLPFARGESSAAPIERARVSSSVKSGLGMIGRMWGGIVAALLALVGFGGAAGWFSVRTPNGTIIVDNAPQDAQVSVDGHKVTVARNGDSLAISAMERGSHHLELTYNGHDLWTNDVAIGVASQLVRVKFEPADRPNVASNVSVSPPAKNARTTTADPAGSKPTGEPKGELESADAQRETASKFPLYSHWVGHYSFSPQNDATASVINLEGSAVVLEVRVPNFPTRQIRCAVDHEHVTVLRNDAIGDRPDGSPAGQFSNIKIAGTIIGRQLSLSGTQAQWDPKRRVYAAKVHFKLTLQREDTDAISSQASSPKAAQKLGDSLSIGSVWEGKRFYRKGAWEKEAETYFLHVTSREGEKFKAHVFSSRPQKNQAEVEGEISGSSIRWEERLGPKTVAVQGTINDGGKIIQLTFHGTWQDRPATTDGDGELSLDPKSVAVENK